MSEDGHNEALGITFVLEQIELSRVHLRRAYELLQLELNVEEDTSLINHQIDTINQLTEVVMAEGWSERMRELSQASPQMRASSQPRRSGWASGSG